MNSRAPRPSSVWVPKQADGTAGISDADAELIPVAISQPIRSAQPILSVKLVSCSQTILGEKLAPGLDLLLELLHILLPIAEPLLGAVLELLLVLDAIPVPCRRGIGESRSYRREREDRCHW